MNRNLQLQRDICSAPQVHQRNISFSKRVIITHKAAADITKIVKWDTLAEHRWSLRMSPMVHHVPLRYQKYAGIMRTVDSQTSLYVPSEKLWMMLFDQLICIYNFKLQRINIFERVYVQRTWSSWRRKIWPMQSRLGRNPACCSGTLLSRTGEKTALHYRNQNLRQYRNYTNATIFTAVIVYSLLEYGYNQWLATWQQNTLLVWNFIERGGKCFYPDITIQFKKKWGQFFGTGQYFPLSKSNVWFYLSSVTCFYEKIEYLRGTEIGPIHTGTNKSAAVANTRNTV